MSSSRALLRGIVVECEFRLRCVSALTHPATVAALGLLLVNDLLLKALWPGAWVTGKLSDLAWMAFAPPLLAFALSFATRGRPFAERAAFAAAYAGLPALYAAFNTFAPVHDVIIRGLLLLSGAAVGSPLDPTDSLAIPPGMAVAWWVWRRPAVAAESVRARLGLLAAAAAAFAAVATSPSPVALGITSIGAGPDGTMVAGADFRYAEVDRFISTDGGVTWEEASWEEASERGIETPPEQRLVTTPRGRYGIVGTSIVLITPDGARTTVYSAAYLRGDSNRWVQAQGGYVVEGQTYSANHILTTEPLGIAYDPDSGNVVVAMGLQGVVVGTPDGRWLRAGVGVYGPIDFSARARLRLVFSDAYFWLLAIASAAYFMTVASILAFTRYRDSDFIFGIGIGALLSLPLIGREGNIAVLFGLFILLLPVFPAVVDNRVGRTLRLFMAVYSGAALVGVWLAKFRARYQLEDIGVIPDEGMQLFLLFPVFIFAAAMAVPYARHVRARRTAAALLLGFVGVFAATIAAVLWWLMTGVSLAFSMAAALGLSALITFALVRHLGTQRTESEDSAGEAPAHTGRVVLAAAAAAAFLTALFIGSLLWLLLTFLLPPSLFAFVVFSIAIALVPALTALALIRLMSLAPPGALNERRQKQWRAVLTAGLAAAGAIPTLFIWAFFGEFFGEWSGYRVASTVLFPMFIMSPALCALIACGLARCLARLRAASERETPADGFPPARE